MQRTIFKPIQSLVSLFVALRKVIEKKLTREKINDLTGLIVTAIVLLAVQAFTALLIFGTLEYLR
jgi:hypothetical protein